MNDSVISPRTAPGAIATPASPLIATRIGLAIDDLLATITLTQHYTNREDRAIEVSYTIALPTGAVLLDVEAEIGDQRLRGKVQARVDAEMRYEQALAEGHSAFAIRLVDDQLLNIALGNLKPGERLTLRVVLAQWLLWNGDRVRLTLPTTIAPRYGTSRMQPADQPVVDLLAEHGFRLDGQVRGLLAGAELASATHRLAVRAVEQGIDFAIERGQLDRDIVIDLRDAEQPLRVGGSKAADLAGRDAAMIAFCAAPTAACRRAVVAELVIDCSGSMGGVSIEQTRAAVRAIVAQLTPQDRVNVLRFGSSHQWLLRRPQPATLPVQRTLLLAADDMQADLGGTELLSALNAGLQDLARLPREVNGERVLFVISDGEVWNLDTAEFLARCTRERVRVFAVAVGSAAVESTFAPLTRATGGSLERVLPSDAMAERIQRHFARVRGGALRELRVRWPAASRDAQGPGELYPGDGALLSAILDANGEPGDAEVSWIDPDGAPRQLRVPLRRATDNSGLAVPSNLARMLACGRFNDIADVAKATRLAIDYQLVTEHSAITLVLERAPGEQLDQLPELRVVPQMLAARWGGTATDDFSMDLTCFEEAPMPRKLRDQAVVAPDPLAEYDYLDMPAFLRREPEDTSAVPSPSSAQPAPASAGAVQRFAAKLGAMLRPRKGAQRDGNDASGVRQTDITGAMRRELVALLVARLRADSKLIGALLRGEIGLSALALELSPALFNWLDEQAERQGSDLESGAFWRDLIEQLCSDDSAQGLRRLLGR
jgi:Ca-activated chloride channel family protein